ncbi:MAG: lytic transglycosylase domain-containing protein [Deltaproteobacteria bacterium]|nr:lytic transglycosylase domain-containing protein [Deltaproteobacteria bacterium]
MDELDRVILDIAPAYNIDPSLIKSIIEVESEFSPNAISQKGAIGLMQIMPETAFEMGIDDPWNPAQNITAGTKYLSILLKRYNGNLPLALAAYNAGPTMVQTYNGIPPFQETIEYVKKVLKSIGK